MCFAWFWQQFRPGKFETGVLFVSESSAKDFCFVRVDMKQKNQRIAVQENAWMWIKNNWFDVHTEQVERKALKSLDLLRRVKETESISTQCMLHLYKALIVPVGICCSCLADWQLWGLEKVQRKGLAMCLRVPRTSGLEALEVEARVKPLSIRREELAVRQAARILMKPDDACLKISWDSFLDRGTTERKISPFGKMNVQDADMSTNTGIFLQSLEKEFNFLDSLQPSKRPPEYWQTLGSSKSRTAAQEKLSREVIDSLVENCDAETVVAFTDGSCLRKSWILWSRGMLVYPWIHRTNHGKTAGQ